MVSIFIENIYVYEDERIEIVMKYKDEYETVLEYILGNRKIVPETEYDPPKLILLVLT